MNNKIDVGPGVLPDQVCHDINPFFLVRVTVSFGAAAYKVPLLKAHSVLIFGRTAVVLLVQQSVNLVDCNCKCVRFLSYRTARNSRSVYLQVQRQPGELLFSHHSSYIIVSSSYKDLFDQLLDRGDIYSKKFLRCVAVRSFVAWLACHNSIGVPQAGEPHRAW